MKRELMCVKTETERARQSQIRKSEKGRDNGVFKQQKQAEKMRVRRVQRMNEDDTAKTH